MVVLKFFTERLKLRLVEMADLEAIHVLHHLAETDQYNTLGIPKDLEETNIIVDGWINDHQKKTITNYTFAVEFEKGGFVGLVSLKLSSPKFNSAEIWYKINVDFWNQGYATEAILAVIRFGFDRLKLHRIEAGCAVENLASIRVLEKAGMTREGRKRQILPLVTGWMDSFEYAILDEEWKA
ncbi:GNAT family acetyltransferase [Pedobacter lusitanus]|uniref:GNAT family acetyltransferase n=1 Tax=Pedobacter lusitanus TaxID=1503925 RepID=A0A0D0GK57_9SPHI|nr:GNAT family protein [Pedobacter lusitanus]KIO76555.1 GNAT family acetyltransferase [Pedobacter lusitanus]